MHSLRARLIQVLVHASSGPRPSDKGWGRGGRSPKKVFSPFRASVWSKNKGEAWAPGPLGPRAPEPQDTRAPGPRAPSLDAPQYAVLQNSKYRQPL